MRAISLHQPWASAIAAGLKSNETRHWETDYRGPLAIHAACIKQSLRGFRLGLLGRAPELWPHVAQAFKEIGITSPASFPLGKIVAVCDLVDCIEVERIRDTIAPVEREFGDYSDGRFAWLLRNVRRIESPIPFTGRQRFFNVPDALFESARDLTFA